MSDHRRMSMAQSTARGLGWFSIALGLTEVFAAKPLARALGLDEQSELIRAYGFRELATGVGIFTQDNPASWVWGRVAGDALDLATLASGLDQGNPRREAVIGAMAAVAGVTLVDICTAQALGNRQREAARPRRSYADRSGFPRGAASMRGAVLDRPEVDVLKRGRPDGRLPTSRSGDQDRPNPGRRVATATTVSIAVGTASPLPQPAARGA